MRENSLKRRMQAGETVLGSWLSLPDGLASEAMANLGWDWLLIDMEHGPVPLEALQKHAVDVPDDLGTL